MATEQAQVQAPSDLSPDTFRAMLAEFINLTIFVFIGAGTVVVTKAAFVEAQAPFPAVPSGGFVLTIAFAHGLVIAALVAATMRISGAHINPAVTFAALLTGKIGIVKAILYIAAQLAGAVVGALLLKAVIAGPLEMGLGAHGLGSTFLLEDQIGDGAGAGLVVEIVLTFILVFVIFGTAMDPRGPTLIAPIAIGFAVLVDHLVGIPLTGASMNPARSFGPALVANTWTDHWVYWVGPLVGAGIAGLVYELFFMHSREAT